MSPILKIFIPGLVVFWFGIGITPFFSTLMYRYKLWKRSGRGNKEDNPDIADNFASVHDDVAETSTPRVGGVIIWISIILVALFIWVLAEIFPQSLFVDLDFISRSQTWLPLFALLVASGIGLVDDMLQIFGGGIKKIDGLGRWSRILAVAVIGLVGALWFFLKLDVTSIMVPFFGPLSLGLLFIPFFIFVVVGTFSGGVIDGIDGLAGGVLATAFAAFGTIGYFQDQFAIAAFCIAVVGGVLAFLWFNVPPARFYMGETGMLGLTVTLALVAFLTDAVIVLPIIAFPLVISSASSSIQMIGRRFFKKRIFTIAPLHHHLEASGWSKEKITMRYWILSVVLAIGGVIIMLIG